jgi:hypothetical protein
MMSVDESMHGDAEYVRLKLACIYIYLPAFFVLTIYNMAGIKCRLMYVFRPELQSVTRYSYHVATKRGIESKVLQH